MTTDPRTVATQYFDSWRAQDLETFRSLLADDVEFIGPLAHLHGADEVCRSIVRLAGTTTAIDVHKQFVDGDDVLTWFDLHTSIAPIVPVANWSHIEDGKVTRIRVVFDARGLAGAAP